MPITIREIVHRVIPPKTVRKRHDLALDDRSYVKKKHACPACSIHIEEDELIRHLYVCPSCGHHFRIEPAERIRILCDDGVFDEMYADLEPENPIEFPGYEEKVQSAQEKANAREAVQTGIGRLDGRKVVLAVMSFKFLGGSMGSVVGEKIARAMRVAAARSLPLVLFTASGGARMHEGIFSLMQMAKTSQAATLLDETRQPFIVVLTDPTTGGVTASFAMLGDVTLAEPGALIGFAGPRVIEGTIRQKLPEGFQRSEFQKDKGFVDAVVPRSELKSTLVFLIDGSRIKR
ncbi:MAG: acetyl-CoA carboxylase, carboxyltransferase subunit beta [Spirochaetaceae bacterium]